MDEEECDNVYIETAKTVEIKIEPNYEELEILETEDYKSDKDFKCTICPSEFHQKDELYSHVKQHFKPTQCKICNKTLIGNLQVEYHMNHIHQINIIESDDKEPDEIDLSKKYPLTEPTKLVQSRPCKYCPKTFPTLAKVRAHMRHDHPDKMTVCCEICGRMCRDEAAAEQHRITHTDQKSFVCDFCGKGFSRKANLVYHLNTHTGNRPFKCDECEKSFSHMSGLICHKRFHSGDRPYQCPYCDRRFGHSTDLRRHRRSHGFEQKRFKCEHCSLEFYESKFLRNHLRTHKAVRKKDVPEVALNETVDVRVDDITVTDATEVLMRDDDCVEEYLSFVIETS